MVEDWVLVSSHYCYLVSRKKNSNSQPCFNQFSCMKPTTKREYKFYYLKIAKVDVRSNCVCLKLRYSIHAYCILGFLFYGKRTTSKIIVIEKALNIIFNNYYLRAEVTSDLFVASGEGPKFFQNLHLSINVFLRIYELEIRAKRQPNLFSTKSCQLRR
ncbi:hypothetical protein Avbf_03801 [Armadillidium vulgare]|nr:hypothetical protein Avbf_03801 [Armadillidium vulgare]